MNQTAVSLFLDRAATPAVVAVRHHEFGIWVPVTWGELIDSARRLGGGLLSMAVSEGDVVGLVMANHPQWLAADIAIQGTGAATLAIDPSTEAEKVVSQLEATGAIGVLCGDQEQFDKVEELRATGRASKLEFVAIFDTRGVRSLDDLARDDRDVVLTFKQLSDRSSGDLWNASAAALDDSQRALIHNSHSFTHSDVVAGGRNAAQVLSLAKADRVLAQASFADPVERSISIMGLLENGLTVAIGEGGSLAQAELTAVQPTVLHAAPGFLERTDTTLNNRIKSARGLRKFALGRSWKPATPSSSIKRPVPLLKFIGLAMLVAMVAVLWLTPKLTDPKRILALLAIALVAGLAAIFTGAAVTSPLRRQLGLKRTRVVVGSPSVEGVDLLGRLGLSHLDRSSFVPSAQEGFRS